MQKLASLLSQLSHIVSQLETEFVQYGKKFTPDGHLVGSIGEVWAAEKYGLKLLPNSAERYDAESKDGKRIQIKTTQKNSIALSGDEPPDYLLVLKLDLKSPQICKKIFYCSGPRVWQECGKKQKNGQRSVSLSKLRALADASAGA